jgi:hypothetical protein
MEKGNVKMLIRNLREMEENKQCTIQNVVESAELVPCDGQGTPIIGEHGEKICNCAEPWQSLFPDNKYYCLHCWGEWYH